MAPRHCRLATAAIPLCRMPNGTQTRRAPHSSMVGTKATVLNDSLEVLKPETTSRAMNGAQGYRQGSSASGKCWNAPPFETTGRRIESLELRYGLQTKVCGESFPSPERNAQSSPHLVLTPSFMFHGSSQAGSQVITWPGQYLIWGYGYHEQLHTPVSQASVSTSDALDLNTQL